MYDLNPEQAEVVRQYSDKLARAIDRVGGTGLQDLSAAQHFLRNRAGRLRHQPPRGISYWIQDWSQWGRSGGPQRPGATD